LPAARKIRTSELVGYPELVKEALAAGVHGDSNRNEANELVGGKLYPGYLKSLCAMSIAYAANDESENEETD
jgi:hypothetical protein